MVDLISVLEGWMILSVFLGSITFGLVESGKWGEQSKYFKWGMVIAALPWFLIVSWSTEAGDDE